MEAKIHLKPTPKARQIEADLQKIADNVDPDVINYLADKAANVKDISAKIRSVKPLINLKLR